MIEQKTYGRNPNIVGRHQLLELLVNQIGGLLQHWIITENLRAAVKMNDDWEQSKENVAPVKSGRSVKGLGGVGGLANKPVLGKDLGGGEEEKKYERAIEEAREEGMKLSEDGASLLPEGEEMVLQAYIRYYKWVRDTYKSSNDKSKAVLEKVTSEFKDSSSMKNNATYVKMWIELADMMRTPSEIFGFMQTNKIGEKVSLFWVAWAFVAEKAEKYDVTEQIFRKGIKKMAEPKDLLQNRFNQFQRRMVSRIRNGEIAEPGEKKSSESAGGRQALSSLSRNKTSKSSSQRTGSAISSTSGGLARDANTNSRRVEQSGNRAGGRFASSSGSASRATNSSGATPAMPTGGNFTIFSEDATAGAAPVEEEKEENKKSDWKELGHENKRTKENHMPVSTWSEAPLGKGGNEGAPSALGFAIFSDGDAPKDPEPEEDEPVKVEVQPVAAVATSQSAQMASAANMTIEEQSILANLSAMDEEDGTINTRLAMGTIDAMFCDSPPPPAAAVKESKPKEDVAASSSFSIFTDN